MYNLERDSFVVVSDFHSNKWPLDKVIKYYINEYDKVYILGDATDRGEKEDGTGGLDLLFKIRELTKKYPNRVFYIPGNHDDFLYGYGKYKDYDSNRLLRLNHGNQTIKDIDNLSRNNPEKLEELMDWLGNLPLQKEHFYQEKRYVLAHALFDEILFKKNKKFSLEDYRNNEGNRDEIINFIDKRILLDLNNMNSIDDIIEDILDLYYIDSTYFNCNGNGKVARIKDVREYLDEVVMSYIEQVKDYKEALTIYITEVAMDYISKCLLKKYGNRNKAERQIEGLLEEEDYTYITRNGNARNMTKKIGIDNIYNWVEKCKYVSYQDYLTSKFGKQYDY